MHKSRYVSAILSFVLILGSWKGYVAIFNKGSTEPKQIFPTPVDSLPPTDQQYLAEGILVRNERDLQQLLEDYLS